VDGAGGREEAGTWWSGACVTSAVRRVHASVETDSASVRSRVQAASTSPAYGQSRKSPGSPPATIDPSAVSATARSDLNSVPLGATRT
jgi:hypothetical protein